VAAAATFSNSSTITINDVDVATPYPSTIEVSNVSASVQDVNLTLNAYSHTFPTDVGVLLVGPHGQTAQVMSDAGGGVPVFHIDLTFDNEATGFLPDEPTTGSYKPTAGPNAVFPSPAPSGPYGTDLSVFDGKDPTGTWSLYVIDDAAQDIGSISGGWSLDISTATPADTTPPTVTDTSLSATTPQGDASKTTNVTATFSEPVQNVTPETFMLERKIAVKKSPAKFERVDATVTLSSTDGKSAELNPALDLPKGDYRATITTEVTDLANPANALDQDSTQAGNQPKVWTFKVAK